LFIFLRVRYNKLARDVPQSMWIIDSGSNGVENNLDVDNMPLQHRKGRNSVEEIISHAVQKVLQCAECRLHACGREDIDVRCLG